MALAFVQELIVAVGVGWFFAAWYPSISDYRAHRSRAATQRKINQLEQQLKDYEEDFADVRLFLTRVVRLATSVILIGVFTQLFVVMQITSVSTPNRDVSVSAI